MPDYPVQGRLRIRAENFERDIEFVKQRVGEVSRPQLKSYPGYEHIKFWWVDFAATSEQWQALEPELDKRNIAVTMYESPALYMEALAEERKSPDRIGRGGRLQRIPLAGILIFFAGIAGAVFVPDLNLIFFCLSGLGLLLAIGGRALAEILQKRMKADEAMREQRRK